MEYQTSFLIDTASPSVKTTQWENENRSAFPLSDPVYKSGLPPEAIIDACIVAPRRRGEEPKPVTLTGFHFGTRMVSAFISSNGVPVLHARLFFPEKGDRVFEPVTMEPLTDGFAGTITFGNIGPDTRTPFTWRGEIPFAEPAIVRPVVGRLDGFFRPSTGQTAYGDVGIELPDGISAQISQGEDGWDPNESVITFKANASLRSRVTMCDPGLGDDEADTATGAKRYGGRIPVKTINRLAPDKYGRIAIVFTSYPPTSGRVQERVVD